MIQKEITYRRKMVYKELLLKFHPTDDLLMSKNFHNIKKVRCIALDERGMVCMVSNDGIHNWMIPGGTVEKNENPILALKRELQEEADVTIKKYKLLGFLEMHFINKEAHTHYQRTEMIFTAEVDKISEQTEDPAIGITLHREFFDVKDMAFKYMRWGKISKYIVEYFEKRRRV